MDTPNSINQVHMTATTSPRSKPKRKTIRRALT